MYVMLLLALTLFSASAAVRKNPTAKNKTTYNLTLAFAIVACLTVSGYTLGKDMALSDAASPTLKACKI